MIDWFNNIWKAYLYNNNDFNEDRMGYLVIDQATSHITPNVLTLLKGGQDFSSH